MVEPASVQIGWNTVQQVLVQRPADALLAALRSLLVAPPRVQEPRELLDHAARHLHREAALAAGGALDRRDDRLDRAALDEVAVGSRLEHLHDRLAVVGADSASTRVFGEQRLMPRAALAPPPGMRTPSTATAGFSRIDTRIACEASAGSRPARRRLRATRLASAARAFASSSATSTRIGWLLMPGSPGVRDLPARQPRLDGGAVPRRGLDEQAATAAARARMLANPSPGGSGPRERVRNRSRRRRRAPHCRRGARAASR